LRRSEIVKRTKEVEITYGEVRTQQGSFEGFC
jgi:hypothetical protein